MSVLATHYDCCGCGACAQACPKKCIEMKPDKTGFLYPVIDKTQCVNCGKCTKSCLALEPVCENTEIVATYGIQHKEDSVLFESTSGGAFSAFAKCIIDAGGVVFGVEMVDFKIYHTVVTSVDELYRFRGSKYVQSDVKNTYKEAEEYLKNGTKVLYSGTPCQIQGLKKYLGKEYENLFTVDVICRAVPSPMLFNKYIEFQTQRLGEIKNFRFRDKALGYDNPILSFDYTDKKGRTRHYAKGSESDEWLRCFSSNEANRESCKDCISQSGINQSDITIADLYNVNDLAPEMDNNGGCTRVLVQSEKGKWLISQVSDDVMCKEIVLKAKKKARNASRGSTKDKEIYWADANNLSADEFFAKYYRQSFKIRAKRIMRLVAAKTGIYSKIRQIVHSKRNK